VSTRPEEAGKLRQKSFLVIDGEPCRVVEIEKSKPGKHGSAKVRIVAIGLFDNVKRTLVLPADARVDVPIVKKFTAQVTSITGDTVQLMSLDDYSIFEVLQPEDEEIRSRLEPGVEVEVWEIVGRHKITRIRS